MKFRLPELGEGVIESELVRWHVKDGDVLRQDQILAEFMTDKASIELPFPHASGRVLKRLVTEGSLVKIGAELFDFEAEGVVVEEAKADGSEIAENAKVRSERPESTRTRREALLDEETKAAPVVRRRAFELGVDLARVRPSGEGGRITLADVERSAKVGGSESEKLARHFAGDDPIHVYALPGDERKPLVGIRKAILKQMVQSKRTIPHFSYVEEMDAGNLIARRESDARKSGVPRTYLPYFVEAVVKALKAYPLVHTAVDVDDTLAGEIVFRNVFHIGIAMATSDGLLVPVIRNADQKSLEEISAEIRGFREKAEAKKLKPEDMNGGTFTITSMGVLGGVMATPIIRAPEVGILSIHSIRERPAVVGGKLAVRPLMNLVGAFDHRVVDGVVAAEFVQNVIKHLSVSGSGASQGEKSVKATSGAKKVPARSAKKAAKAPAKAVKKKR